MNRLFNLFFQGVFFCFLAGPFGVNGQTGRLQDDLAMVGTVTDQDGYPLPYVNIGIVGTTIGTVSGTDGSFILYLSENTTDKDVLRFSMVGHESRSFTLEEYVESMTDEVKFILPLVTMDLQEVVVRPRFDRKKRIGVERTNAARVTNFAISKRPNQNLGAEIGRKFNLPKGNVQLDSFQFYIANNNFDTVRLRINVYEIEKGKPGRNLAPENMIVELTNGQTGWAKIDLSPYHFLVSENVAVTVEWVFASAKGRSLAIPITMPSPANHFYKYGSQGRWKQFPGMSAAMSLDVSY